jgi:hypothetical protein
MNVCKRYSKHIFREECRTNKDLMMVQQVPKYVAHSLQCHIVYFKIKELYLMDITLPYYMKEFFDKCEYLSVLQKHHM